jgi:hypothetical protein
LRSAHRNAYSPDYRSANAGFRLAVTPDSNWMKNVKAMKKEAEKNAEKNATPKSGALKKEAELAADEVEISAATFADTRFFETIQ